MEKRPTLRFLAGGEDAGSTPDPAAPIYLSIKIKLIGIKFYLNR